MTKRKQILVAAAPMEVRKDLVKSSLFDEIHYCGVGSHAATVFAAQNILLVKGADILLVGSCGVFGAFTAPELFGVSAVAWRPQSYRKGQSRMLEADLEVLGLSGQYGKGLKPASCVCASALSFDDSWNPQVTATNPDQLANASQNLVENMELYSLAKVWLPEVHSFSAVLGSTNSIGPGVHEDWKENFSKVSDMTLEHLRRHR